MHAQWFGQKTYNGVALISRQSASDVVKNIPGFADDMARVITATIAGVRVIGAYFPNGQAPGSDKFAYKMRWLDALREWVRAELAAHPKLVLLGDYNITFDDLDVWDPVGLAGTIHCTDEERTHLPRAAGPWARSPAPAPSRSASGRCSPAGAHCPESRTCQPGQRRIGDALGLHAQLLGALLQEMARQHRDVFAPLAQRGRRRRITFRRWNRSSRNRPRAPAAPGSGGWRRSRAHWP
jgi:hypothetical protein